MLGYIVDQKIASNDTKKKKNISLLIIKNSLKIRKYYQKLIEIKFITTNFKIIHKKLIFVKEDKT
jgi:hypothetical protein